MDEKSLIGNYLRPTLEFRKGSGTCSKWKNIVRKFVVKILSVIVLR